MPKCVVRKCPHQTGKKSMYPQIVLHPFPKSIKLIQDWLRLAGMEEENLELVSLEILEDKRSDKFRMCSAHFTQDSYILKGSKRVLRVDARPSKFPERSVLDFAQPPMMHRIAKRARIEQSLAQASEGLPPKVKCTCKCHAHLKARLVNASTQTEPSDFFTLASVEPYYQQIGSNESFSQTSRLSDHQKYTMEKEMDTSLVPSLDIMPVKCWEKTEFQIKEVEKHTERGVRPSENSKSLKFIGGSEEEHTVTTNELSSFDIITVDNWESVGFQIKQEETENENCTLHSEDTISDKFTSEMPSAVTKSNQNREDYVLEIKKENSENGQRHHKLTKSKIDGSPLGKKVHKRSSLSRKPARKEEGKVRMKKEGKVRIKKDDPFNENGHLSVQSTSSLIDNTTVDVSLTTKHKRRKKNTDTKLPSSKVTDSKCPNSLSTEEDTVSLSLEEKYAKEKKYVVFESCLDVLLFNMQCQHKYCSERIIEFDKHTVGSLLVVSGTCCRGHTLKLWESQPRVNGVGAGNVLLATLLVLTGSSFTKIKGLCDIIALQIFSESSFHRYEDKYIFPGIDQWIQEEDELQMSSETQQEDVALDRR